MFSGCTFFPQVMRAMSGAQKKYRIAILIVLFVLPFVCLEGASSIIYNKRYTDKEKLFLRCLMGLAPAYSPRMISMYKPHHYLVYVLNAPLSEDYQRYYGSKPSFRINSRGFRGKDVSVQKADGTYRIVCLGGSTTFGIDEPDEGSTYPQLLEDALNREFRSPRFEVVNAGTPAWTSAEMLINLQFRLLDLHPDMLITYEGVNDTFAMRRDEEGRADYSSFRKPFDYRQPEGLERTLCASSAFYRLYYIHTHRLAPDICSMTILPKPPETDEDANLDRATGKYFKQNMDSIVAIAQANGIATLMVTMGHGPWHRSLALNNETTRQISQSRGTLLTDFEKAAQPAYFTGDNVHLTRAGNGALANEIVQTIAGAGFPFVKRAGGHNGG